jgi:hypothetical protein
LNQMSPYLSGILLSCAAAVLGRRWIEAGLRAFFFFAGIKLLAKSDYGSSNDGSEAVTGRCPPANSYPCTRHALYRDSGLVQPSFRDIGGAEDVGEGDRIRHGGNVVPNS